ncbi:HNH endonuclease signature motif containing protein [Nitrobacter sp.]|uniref:HNH endonuclease signature motif containing protein n=1 Tax=Nitrobacter sp. TaxID=29420 RepID=UPI00399D572D
MPFAAPRLCTCGKVVPAGKRCQCVIKRKAERDRLRPTAPQRGYDSSWGKLRASWLAKHPVCVDCGGAASLVDHIQSIRRAPHRRLDVTNLQSMCATCHGRKTARVDGSFGRKTNDV